VLPGWNTSGIAFCGDWTPDGKYFLFNAIDNYGNGYSFDLWAIRERRALFRNSKPTPIRLTSGPLEFTAPLPSKDGKKLFAVGVDARSELARYDLRSKQLTPYLSEISTVCLDFSKDMQWITYTTTADYALWRSRVDGSEKRQLTFHPMVAALSRWSPDGKRIVFQGMSLGKPRVIYMVGADGGPVEEIIPWHSWIDWLADGSSIVLTSKPAEFGLPQSSLQIMDLSSRQLSTLPNSAGLHYPRVSPDGRYIAALRLVTGTLCLFDISARKWRELENVNVGTGWCPMCVWSRDSKYVYVGTASPEQWLCRVRIADAKLEHILSLKGVRGSWLPWIGVAPDGSPLISRDTGSREIYALRWDAP